MKTVYKYNVALSDHLTTLELCGKIVHVDIQDSNSGIMLWAEYDSNVEPTSRSFYVVGTGHSMSDMSEHVRTVVDGRFVWHVYELVNN